jgi:hypothetical protein
MISHSPLLVRPLIALLALLAMIEPLQGKTEGKPAQISIAWNQVLLESKTSLSLQVVANPLLRPGSAIHDAAFKALADMGADYVRYVPWLPYPRLAVAELEPPTGAQTSWDFTLLDPTMADFMRATGPHHVMVNFSTIPAWLFKTEKRVNYPDDPNEVNWSYTQGTELREGGLKELGEYYARLVSWYVNGGFIDELGRRHDSGHHFKISYWEVFNEVDFEHTMTPQQYTERYDAVVSAVHKVAPETKFVGIAMALPSKNSEMFEYFLNPANHQTGIPLDMISYHFYATPEMNQTADHWQYTFFDQADRFIATVRYIDSIRRRLSPTTKIALNEIGSILPADMEASQAGAPKQVNALISSEYWNASGALFAYIFVEVAKLGVDIVSTSQLVGFPSQFPSVSMVDWKTGTPNARYQVLKLLHDHFGPGDRFVVTSLPGWNPDVLAQGIITPKGRKLLLINKRYQNSTVRLPEPVTNGTFASIDVTTGDKIERVESWSGQSIELQPFAVAVLTLKE